MYYTDLMCAKLSKTVYSKFGGEAAEIEYVLVDNVLALRGTGKDKAQGKKFGCLKDIITDLRFFPVKGPHASTKHPAGFYKAALALSKEPMLNSPDIYPLIITGHSLGGAVAILLGEILLSQSLPIQKVVTFGAPKVGKTFYLDYKRLFQYKYRGDAVTSLGILPHPTKQYQLGKTRFIPRFKDHSIDLYIADMEAEEAKETESKGDTE